MRTPVGIASSAQAASERVRSAWWPAALASLAAALAWLVAHRLLGHPQPFFAPIAAAISLSTSPIGRSRRIVQLVIGVLLGIGIGDALGAVLGTGTAALGVIVFVTMIASLASGISFFSEGMMFANQAAASAILVVALHHHGTGGERAIDAIVGGAVAFVIGVVLFPADPLALLRDAERSVLRTLAATLRRVAALISGADTVDDGWALRAGSEIHRQLGALAEGAGDRTRERPRRSAPVAPAKRGRRGEREDGSTRDALERGARARPRRRYRNPRDDADRE